MRALAAPRSGMSRSRARTAHRSTRSSPLSEGGRRPA
jgi:hypothetical protein